MFILGTLTRVDLERKLQTLREELEFENIVHQETSSELKAQLVTRVFLTNWISSKPKIYKSFKNWRIDPIRVQVDAHGPDMNDLLRDIRAQYDAAAKKSREDAEQWYNA